MRTTMKFITILLTAFALLLSSAANAECDIAYTINLNTFGEGVRVELRSGIPGKSKVKKSRNSSGGKVKFNALCQGNYFLAIGNKEQVSITPVHYFEEHHEYTSNIILQQGTGNVETRSRSSL